MNTAGPNRTPASGRGSTETIIPGWLVVFLFAAMLFDLAVLAVIAFNHDESSLFFLALGGASSGVLAGQFAALRRCQIAGRPRREPADEA